MLQGLFVYFVIGPSNTICVFMWKTNWGVIFKQQKIRLTHSHLFSTIYNAAHNRGRRHSARWPQGTLSWLAHLEQREWCQGEEKVITQMLHTLTHLQASVNKETYRGKNGRNWCQPIILETPTKSAEGEYFFLSLTLFNQHNTIHV